MSVSCIKTCHLQALVAGPMKVRTHTKQGALLHMFIAKPRCALQGIGFEDHTGTKGVQISLGTVPSSGTKYEIPKDCHVAVFSTQTERTCDARCNVHFDRNVDNDSFCSCQKGCTQGKHKEHSSELAAFTRCQ